MFDGPISKLEPIQNQLDSYIYGQMLLNVGFIKIACYNSKSNWKQAAGRVLYI